MAKVIPEFVRHNCSVRTSRQWRAQKRQQLDTALRAIGEYARGSAYTPEYDAFAAARLTLLSVRKAISTKEWK